MAVMMAVMMAEQMAERLDALKAVPMVEQLVGK